MRQVALAASLATALASTSAAVAGISLRDLVEVADIEDLALSPDGTRVAFRVQRPSVARNSHRIDIYVADFRTGHVRRIADGGEPIYNDGTIESEPPVWSPDGRYLYRRALVSGAIGLWRTAADGSGSKLIAGGAADVEQLEPSADGRSLRYVTGPSRGAIEAAEEAEYEQGVLVDGSVDPTQALFRGAYVHGHKRSQRLTGRWYQHEALLWREPRHVHRIDLMTARPLDLAIRTVAEPPLMTTKPVGPSLAAQLGGLAASVTGSGEAQRLEASDPALPRTRLLCDSAACRSGDIVAIGWRPGRHELVFTRQNGHLEHALNSWDPVANRVRQIARIAGQASGGRSSAKPCAITASRAICVVAEPVSPPRLEAIDLDSGARSVLWDPNAALRRMPAPAAEKRHWTLPDGRRATGIILYARRGSPKAAPLFVNYYYCGGYLRGGLGDAYPLAPLVDAGFVVACLNIVPFREWGDGADRERAALASVKAVTGDLASRGWIDPAKIGMGGFSAGSEATMWVAMNSDLLAAAAVVSPQYEPSHYWLSSVRGRDFAQVLRTFQQLGSPEEDPARWKLISPALNVDRIKAPLLMQVPEQEMRAGIELYAKLSNTRTPTEMYAFPEEAHWKLQPRHQLAVYRRNFDWFRYWLQDTVDPDPGLSAQYARWKALRERRLAGIERP